MSNIGGIRAISFCEKSVFRSRLNSHGVFDAPLYRFSRLLFTMDTASRKVTSKTSEDGVLYTVKTVCKIPYKRFIDSGIDLNNRYYLLVVSNNGDSYIDGAMKVDSDFDSGNEYSDFSAVTLTFTCNTNVCPAPCYL